jgi:hypothetical protein
MTRNTIFIFGLPRSRTAWVANLLTWGASMVYHELWSQMNTADDFVAELNEWPEFYTLGNSDSTNLIMADWIFEEYPDAKWVYLERDEADVMVSLEKCQPDLAPALPQLRELARNAKAEVQKRGGLVFQVDDWQPHDTLLLWQYCLPHIPYPKQRNDQLEWMRVTITEDRWGYLKQRAQQLLA